MEYLIEPGQRVLDSDTLAFHCFPQMIFFERSKSNTKLALSKIHFSFLLFSVWAKFCSGDGN